MPKLLVFVVSTRPGRIGPSIAKWYADYAKEHGSFEVELVDLAEVNLPLLDEPNHPAMSQYENEHTKRWSSIVASGDAFAFVTPEYNFGTPPSLVNALDYLFHEWAYKPAIFVSYGGVSGGLRSVQMSKQLMTTLKIVPLTEAVVIPNVFGQLDETGAFNANEQQTQSAKATLDELKRWTDALAVLRS